MQQAKLSGEGKVEELDKVEAFAGMEEFSDTEPRGEGRVEEVLNPVFARVEDFRILNLIVMVEMRSLWLK